MNQLACKMTETEAKLTEMLQENTGKSLLDSGGVYGRHWERNQGVEFRSQPSGKLEFHESRGELNIDVTLDVFHFLNERLEYNEELDQQYREWCEREDAYHGWAAGEEFVESINGKGIYGDDKPFTTNTAGGEDLLSQTLQYVYWTDEGGDAHVLLQIHGGCDMRGGYTDPVAFDVADFDGLGIFDNARASIYCKGCGKHWNTDDGFSWNDDSGQTNLEKYPATDKKPEYPERPDPAQLVLSISTPDRPEPCAGVVRVDEDCNGYCPYCGGLLHVEPWPAS